MHLDFWVIACSFIVALLWQITRQLATIIIQNSDHREAVRSTHEVLTTLSNHTSRLLEYAWEYERKLNQQANIRFNQCSD